MSVPPASQIRSAGFGGLVDDVGGLCWLAEPSPDLGYKGMMARRPLPIETIHDDFPPSPREIGEWQRIIEVMRAGEDEGRGAIHLDGRLVDEARAEMTERKLARTSALGPLGPC